MNKQFYIIYSELSAPDELKTMKRDLSDCMEYGREKLDLSLVEQKFSQICIRAVFSQKENLLASRLNEKDEFLRHCSKYDFDECDYNTPFIYNGKIYYFTGFRPANRKYPCILECHDNNGSHNIKVTPNFVKHIKKNTEQFSPDEIKTIICNMQRANCLIK